MAQDSDSGPGEKRHKEEEIVLTAVEEVSSPGVRTPALPPVLEVIEIRLADELNLGPTVSLPPRGGPMLFRLYVYPLFPTPGP